jgi:hypothetical protein
MIEKPAYTLIVPLNADKSKVATFHLKEIDEATYMAFRDAMDRKKYFDAMRIVLKSCSLNGSDDASILNDNLKALGCAAGLIGELFTPYEGELKKN